MLTKKANLKKGRSGGVKGNSHGRDVVVIGASAGGVQAITTLLPQLPKDMPASIFVVYHIGAEAPGNFDQILGAHCSLRVKFAQDREPIRRQTVYLAVPDHHLIVSDGHIRLIKGPRENRVRPAIDPLFRSAAVARGSRTIGVVLSGTLDDGAAGLAAIQQCGGIAVVQNPEDAMFPEMPRNALAITAADHIVTLAMLGPLLSRLVLEKAPPSPPVPEELRRENMFMNGGAVKTMHPDRMPGKLSMLVCPECGGAMWELSTHNVSRYRCHTGHAFTEQALFIQQNEVIERALWSAVRSLEERAKLYSNMAGEAEVATRLKSASQFRQLEREAMKEARFIRDLIEKSESIITSGRKYKHGWSKKA